jgi:O-antigen ligase
MLKIGRNKQSSSQDLAKHLQSVSNIKSDASNLERINRWSSAVRMFKKEPLFGFGPGTYKFKYAPFQRSTEITYVSTNAGSLGNAHSEYLGPMAEQGLMGTIGMLMIVILSIVTGTRVYQKSDRTEIRLLAIGILIGLFTYFLHGFLNNFLDQDKASAPFWSMIAILVALDVYHHKREKKDSLKKSASEQSNVI